MEVHIDDLSGERIAAFLEEHIQDMRAVSPPESKHALDLSGLRRPEITFWSVWESEELVGCGALKELSPVHGEIKSMRTARNWRRRSVGSTMLRHIISEASRRGYKRLSLETGSMGFFSSAHRLYAKFGFERCGPFGNYVEDPNSLFFTKTLVPESA
ncbi:MAG TPA: GNAT family N-acetyltransferase [Opitutaceae bacterium]|nr:GNAT family N-acetyltransferase [Opitutaceae bacterium]